MANPRKLHGRPSPEHPGSIFLIAQADYLRGLNCADTDVRMLCTETLARDWNALLRASGYSEAILRNASFPLPAPVGTAGAPAPHATDGPAEAESSSLLPRGGGGPNIGRGHCNRRQTAGGSTSACNNRQAVAAALFTNTSRSANVSFEALAFLGAEDREYVRREIYPTDTRLHELLCGT